MAGFMDNYQTVQERIDIFWRLFPNGRFSSEIVAITEKEVIIKASVWADREQVAPTTVDFAHEPVLIEGKMAGMHVELGVTSALGRAISQLGGELSPDKRKASQTEMEKANRIEAKRLLGLADEAHKVGDVSALRDLYKIATDSNMEPAVIKHILELGKGVAEKNPPTGKEQIKQTAEGLA